jgi:hypothetical protein
VAAAFFESSNDQERPFAINGGTANLGNFTIGRTLNTLGSAGLIYQQWQRQRHVHCSLETESRPEARPFLVEH